jgi:hypothetical protein
MTDMYAMDAKVYLRHAHMPKKIIARRKREYSECISGYCRERYRSKGEREGIDSEGKIVAINA